MRKTVLAILPALLPFLGACETARATSLTTPKERVRECEQVCTDVGMKLGAFVVMMNSAGCVCEPLTTPGFSAVGSGAAVASGAGSIIAALNEQARQQREQSQRLAGRH